MTTPLSIQTESYSEWCGFIIKPKLDFPASSTDTGFVVTQKSCNVMPGATWFRTGAAARKGIAAYISACKIAPTDLGCDGQTFWMLMELSK